MAPFVAILIVVSAVVGRQLAVPELCGSAAGRLRVALESVTYGTNAFQRGTAVERLLGRWIPAHRINRIGFTLRVSTRLAMQPLRLG